jgi:uncharacterized protein YgiM (DUF1202 family)
MNFRKRVIATVAAATFAGGGMLAMAGVASAAVAPASASATQSSSASQSHQQTHYYRVTGLKKGQNLAVRSSANSHSRIIGYVKEGATTTGTGESSHGYLKVTASNGKTGWAPTKNLQEIKKNSH